jgi:hypothetical protein
VHTDKQASNEEEQRASSSCQVDQASGCQAPDMTQGFDSELGLTVEKLSTTLNLPADFFKSLGVSDKKQQGIHVVTVPYLDENRELAGIKLLQSLYNGGRFEKLPLRILPYGFWHIPDIKKHGTVILVPSEKDCWVCWHSGIPVLGLPNTDNGFDKWLDHLRDLEVFLWDGNFDRGFLPLLDKNLPGLQVLTAPNDTPSLWEAYARGKDLKALIKELKETGLSSPSVLLQAQREAPISELRRQGAAVFEAPDPLELIKAAIQAQGYGGTLDVPIIAYLAATSRVLKMEKGLAMPVHLLLIAQPGVGKSYSFDVVLLLLPEEAKHRIEAGSGKVLIYDDAPLRHRVLVFSEADSLPKDEDNPATSALRNLMTDHHLHYKVVVPDQETGGFKIQEVNKAGPTVLFTTSVKRLPSQLDSRIFTLEVPDDKEQTTAALRTQAQLELRGRPEPHQGLIAFQSLLQELAPWEVVVPFVERFAETIAKLPNASRIKRDFARLLSLVKSVAVLRHQHRERDEKNRIVAQIADYEVVYHLVNKMFETSVNKVSDKIRQVVQAVEELKAAGVTPISVTAVGNRLGTTKQAAHYSIKTALSEGWLVNTESRRGYPFNLDIGEPLPGSIGLPKPEELEDNEAGEAGVYSLDTYDTPSLTPQRAETMNETGGSQNFNPFPSDESPPWEEIDLCVDDGSGSFDRQSSRECYDCDYFAPFAQNDEFCSLPGRDPCPRSTLGEQSRQDFIPDINETSPEDIVF